MAGTTSVDQITPTGRELEGFEEQYIHTKFDSFRLGEGEYHITVQVVTDSHAFVTTTSGNDEGPVGDPNPAPRGYAPGNSFFNSGSLGFVYTSTGNVFGGGTWDFSFGIQGETVPEPATLVALGLGLAALVARRRRS